MSGPKSCPTRELPSHWTNWEGDEPITEPQRVADCLWLCRPRESWSAAAKWASEATPGMWFPKDYGATWICGRRRAWLLDPDLYPELARARSICLDLGVEAGWSVGSCAYGLLKWIGVKQWPERSARDLLSEHGHAYVQCLPGRYQGATQWDVRSYYYSLWVRLPSLVVHCWPSGKVVWAKTPSSAWSRHRAACEAVGGHKWLRNAIVGAAQGSRAGAPYYHRGVRGVWRGSYGPLAPAAWMVRRSGWELTRRASEEVEAVHSHTDSVMALGGLYPSAWESVGLVVAQKGEGDAEVCWPGCYRIGGHETKWYQRGSRFADAYPPTPAPRVEYYRRWLAA